MEVAIAHDYLTQRGGAERVVLSLAQALPDTPIYTTLYESSATFPAFNQLDVRASAWNKLGPIRRNHRAALPLLPVIAKSVRIPADVIVASSSGWAHGFSYRADSKVVVYCHNPARWLYQTQQYLGNSPTWTRRLALGAMSPALRRWDAAAALRADTYIANSSAVANRIRHTYGIRAHVIPPPPGLDSSGPDVRPRDLPGDFDTFLLTVSRLLPYKNVDAVIDAAARSKRKLVIVGSGPDRARLQQSIGRQAVILSAISDDEMRWLYANCTALIGASYEDFGLTPVEAGMFGKPAVLLRAGGYLDTMLENETGTFFDHPDPEAINTSIEITARKSWDPAAIKAHAALFAPNIFAQKIMQLL